MPSHGAEIIDGIPVVLNDSVMYAFQVTPPIRLGTYNAGTKLATWESSDAISNWLESFRESLTSRSRK
jgi:hypothetical protein